MKVILKSKISDATFSLYKGAQRNAMPMSEQSVALKKNQQTGKFITGFDLEFGEEFEKILKDTKHPKHKLMVERDMIEKALGVSLDGDKDNEFLLNLRIPLCKRNSVEESLILTRPLDKLYYRALIANNYVAETKEQIYALNNKNILYYFSEPQKEESSRMVIAKLKNSLASKLDTYENNKIWLLAVSNKLNLPVTPDLSIEALYNNINTHKDKIATVVEGERIKNIFYSDVRDLQYDFVLDLSFKLYFIENGQNNVKLVDGVHVGSSLEEAQANLKTEKYGESFAKLREKVYSRFKLKE